MDRLGEILELVSSGRAVFVFGSGVSAASTGGTPEATWTGLLDHAIRYARRIDPLLGSDWEDPIRAVMTASLGRGDVAGLVSASSLVFGPIRAAGHQAYASWLEASIGSLTVSNPSVLDALAAIPSPVLTTNIDTLMEQRSGLAAVSWSQATDFQRVLAGSLKAVGHVHGVWTDPPSVVLTESDYTSLLASEATQALLKATSSIKSVVYVGFGAGLEDPNFGQLLKWHRETFAASGTPHYRLCLASEINVLEASHRADSINPVVYGEKHDELSSFLERLAAGRNLVRLSESGIARDVLSESREDLLSLLRAESIVVENHADLNERDIDDLVVPPVLMSVPHSEYLKSRLKKDGARRLEPLDEARRGGVTVIVGEENAGLTTAVRWLLAKCAEAEPLAAPIMVDFRSSAPGSRPLARLLAKEANIRGLIERRNDPLPHLMVGIDNFNPYARKIADSMLEEIAARGDRATFIGCRLGDEGEITDRLRNLGCSPSIVYLGRFSPSDVRAVARLAAPARFEDLAKRALEVLRAEKLPFTPFTVSLLISILLRGEVLASNASPTTVVDQYVSSLLGRGDPLDDSRYTLDVVQREALLADLAALFVAERKGSLPESEVVKRLERFFESFGWKESPVEVLRSFVERKVLRSTSGYVSFTRTAFLYLFSAKQAVSDPAFREAISQDLVLFAPVLRHYAALSRTDAGLLSSLLELLKKSHPGDPDGELFVSVPPEMSPIDHDAKLNRSFESRRQPTRESTSDLEPLDDSTIQEPEPFPLESSSDLPATVRFSVALELSSTALRDSDQVPDLDLKRQLLSQVLDSWGALANSMSTDHSFKEAGDILRRIVREDFGDLPDLEEAIDELLSLLPIAIAAGGIATSLASRKLLLLAESLIEEAAAVGRDRLAVSMVLLLMSIEEPGWVTHASRLLAGRMNLWVVQKFIKEIVYRAALSERTAPTDVEPLIKLAADLVAAEIKFDDDKSRRVHVERLQHRLRIERKRPKSESELEEEERD